MARSTGARLRILCVLTLKKQTSGFQKVFSGRLYLQNGRPKCNSRRLFIRDHAPFEGFRRNTTISNIVQRALARAGVVSARKGAHLLRHSLATEMLRKGASLVEIGEVLRHRSSDSTAIYAKVDLTTLRALALPWIGGAQ
jgi:site-specific recombinase XerD